MIIKRDVWFTPADRIRRLHIWLPEDYNESEERYPVMYFFDGHNLFFDTDATYGKSWGLKEFLEGWSKPIIVVGIECSHEGDTRLSEYCPYGLQPSPWDKQRDLNGYGDNTFRWMVNELKPMIDATYRTWPHREATGLAGSSMGGLMALYGGTVFNDVFSKAACVSPACGICEKQLRADISHSNLNRDTRMWISWGSHEEWCTAPAARFGSLLNSAQVNTRLYEQPDGNHCEADWEKQVPLFMNYLWLED